MPHAISRLGCSGGGECGGVDDDDDDDEDDDDDVNWRLRKPPAAN